MPPGTSAANAARRVVSRIAATRTVAVLPVRAPHPANLMLAEPALANRKITPIAARHGDTGLAEAQLCGIRLA